MAGRQTNLSIPIVCALIAHAGLAAGLTVAEDYEKHRPKPTPKVVVELVDPPPPPAEIKPPEPPPEPEPPKPEPVVEPPKPVVKPKIAEKNVPEPPPQAEEPPPNPEPPAPGPPDPAPAPAPYVFKMETGAGGNMGVQSGAAATGALGGKVGGTGTKPGGGGGPPNSTGTGGVAAVASIKTMPKPLDDDYDRRTIKEADYPEEARRLGIEGQVVVRLLIDATGKVTEATIVKGLGHGLDQLAIAQARRIRFLPARDTNDQPVATRISWSVRFEAPEEL